MAIDIISIYNKYKIHYHTSGAEVTRGWVNVQCPFCGDTHHHLGYNDSIDIFTCWRCGVKNHISVLIKLLKINRNKAEKLLVDYYIAGSKKIDYNAPYQHEKEVFLPDNYGELLSKHKKYLKSRRFDPKELQREWNIVGSNDSRYSESILIPIYFKNRLVSYHSRSILPDVEIKAKACRREDEAIRHKDILYGFDKVSGNSVIVTEGPFDTWRLGAGAVCTFGIKYTESQVSLLSCFKNIFIMFDSGEDELAAKEQAEKLADNLSIFNNVWIVSDLRSDPADLSQRKANKIKHELFQLAKLNK